MSLLKIVGSTQALSLYGTLDTDRKITLVDSGTVTWTVTTGSAQTISAATVGGGGVTGSGAAPRIASWDSASSITGYANFTNDGNHIIATVADAATTTVVNVASIVHTTSGTAAAGFGVGLRYQLEDAGGTTVDAAQVAVYWDQATAGAVRSSYAIRTSYNSSGIAKNIVRVYGDGTTVSGANLSIGETAEGNTVGSTLYFRTNTRAAYITLYETNGDVVVSPNATTNAWRIGDGVEYVRHFHLGSEYVNGSTFGVSSAAQGRLRWNETVDYYRFEMSRNGGAYVAVALTDSNHFAVGTSGTDFAVVFSPSGTVTYNLPDAGASARGVVTTGSQTIAGAKTFSSTLTSTATTPINFTAGANVTFGTTDNFAVIVKTNATAAWRFTNGGDLQMDGNNNLQPQTTNQGKVGTSTKAFASGYINTFNAPTSITSPIHYGSTASNGDLTLYSTSDAAKGNIFFGTSTYDELNNRLGIATTTPVGSVEVVSDGTTGIASSITFTGYSDSNNTNLIGRHAKGSLAAPRRVQDDTTLFNITSLGALAADDVTDATFSPNAGKCTIQFKAAESWTSTANGTRMLFYTTPVGSTTSAERMRIDPSGNITPGTAALATTATDGFTYIQSCPGAPTGNPTTNFTYTGRSPVIHDTTNNRLYLYDLVSAAWQSCPAISAAITPGSTTTCTLAKTGGSGPGTAAQSKWFSFTDTAGTTYYLPGWV